MPRLIATGLALLGLATASSLPPWRPSPSRWPGWSSITHIFSFGDSYTQTGFNASGPQPSRANPLGNPAYPGDTSSNGPNWIDFLTTTWNETFVETVNLAFGGATVDGALIPGFIPTVISMKQQINDQYIPQYSNHPKYFNWQPKSTLFTMFIGINDVNNEYEMANKDQIYPQVMVEYAQLVETLYQTGARNFLFLNVPPIDRSPITVEGGDAAIKSQRADIAAWNKNVSTIARNLKSKHRDSTVFVFDTNALYNQVIDKPCSFPETCAYKDTVDYCPMYAYGTPTWYTKSPDCEYSVDEYFWLNTLHPTFRIHNATAREISRQLSTGRHGWW